MAEAPWRQAAVPPPPPPGATGHIPSSKLKSEISDRRVEPPLCVQNAMLTKDKKPFTYTPGGIDLSEIRSPRMARRLERNAMNEGVSSVPQTHPCYPTGPLPPSALAAMQPQLSVQVFPTGGVPHTGAPPPPPPPPKAPPMKTSPLPTDCFDRPDMTKIIPDNPMAMLRKTSGPIVKQDPILNKNYTGAIHTSPAQKLDSPPVQNNYATPPSHVEPRRQFSAESPTAGVGSIYVPPINQNKVETPPPAPAYYKRQPSTPQPESPKPQTPDTPNSPKPSLSKAPTPWLTQRRQHSQDVPEWAVNDQRVQSPPVQQQQQPQWTPPARQDPPPQSKPVRPWQQPDAQPWQQPEPQQWQQRQPEIQPWQQPAQPDPQQRQPEIQPWQQPSQPDPQQRQPAWQQRQPEQFWQEPTQVQKTPGGGVRKQVQNREVPQQFNPVEKTEVVIVNDPPLVYQHPGQSQQRIGTRHVPQQQDQGVRIVPMQVEGRTSNGQVRSPQQNSDARSLNRQLSWNSTPTQSNTFRVLQKITQTDGDDDEDQVVIEHSPKMYHQFPQRQASLDQQRKWNQNDSDQALMNTFKQVPQGQQNALGPKVRTIPIQIEGNGSTRHYVPPSEQIVQEPKKYMGGSIPSRSFKMLQAMTAPDECVNPDQACENNENYLNDPSSYAQWGFDPNHHPPPPYCYDPYWSYYAQNYPSNSDAHIDPNQNNPRMTPLPYPWNCYPPYYYGPKEKNGSESVNKRNQRTTPIPWQNDETAKPSRAPTPLWNYYKPYEDCPDAKRETVEADDPQNYMYPPYWNPYYYNYYYGAPPPMYPAVYSPYPFYPPQSDTEEVSGYSSNEEMAYYGARFAGMPPFSNGTPRPKSVLKQEPPEPATVPKEEAPRKHHISEEDCETSDSDAEMDGYEVCRNTPGLQAIRSVSDIKVYDAEESSQCSDDEDDDSENTTEENDSSSLCVADDVIPHQLSVIFEESERTDSARLDRESSVSTTISEGTATIENSEDEDAAESDGTVYVKLPLTLKFVIAESHKVTTITVGNSKIVPQVAVRSSTEDTCDNFETHSKTDPKPEESDADVSELLSLKNSESGVDFWADLKKDSSKSDVFVTPKKLVHAHILEESVLEREEESISTKRSSLASSSDGEKSEVDFWEQINTQPNKVDTSSACSRHSNLSSSITVSDEEENSRENNPNAFTENVKTDEEMQQCEDELKPLTIQQRIKLLQTAIATKRKQLEGGSDPKIAVKERTTALQQESVPVNLEDSSRKSSIQSYEGCSEEEEEADSGVTSDVSRRISEVEADLDFLEMKQMNKYQRASTHSRLFKLLQDECDNDDEDSQEGKVDQNTEMMNRRDHLKLPLRQAGSDPESFSSSGFTSPGSPTINDRLVSELIQSLLMKKGQVFKNMTMEKLHAAALRILQEDMDGLETLSSSEDGFPSPKKGVNSPAAYVPQEYQGNFNEYSQYYDSWNEAAKYYDGQYDVLPSKAFRLIQEHSATNKTGAVTGLLARCPRVLSNKNVQKELMRLIESNENPSLDPSEQSPKVNEATSAS